MMNTKFEFIYKKILIHCRT